VPESGRVSGGSAVFFGWAVASWTVPWAVFSFLQFDPWLAPWVFSPAEPFTFLVPVVYVLYCCFLMPLVLLVTGLLLPGRRWRWRIGWTFALFAGFCFEAGAIRYGPFLHVTPYYSIRPTVGPLVTCGGFLLLAMWLWLLLAGRPRLARGGVRAVPRAVVSMAARTRGRRALTACAAFLIVAVTVTRGSGPVMAVTMAGTAVTTVAFSPDGRDLALADDGDVWFVRSVPGNRPVLSVDGEQADSLAFSPHGPVIAIGVGPGVQAWNTVTRQDLFRFGGTADTAVRAVAFSPDGAVIAGGDDSGDVFLLDAATGRPLARLTPAASGVDGLAFNSDGRELVSAADDGTVTLWDTVTGTVLARTAVPAVAADDAARPVSVSFLPGGGAIAIGDARSGLYVWTPRPGTLARKLTWTCGGGPECADSVAFSPSGASVAVTGQGPGGRGAYLWSTVSGALTARVDDPAGYAVASAAISPSGKDLAIGDGDGAQDSTATFGPSGYVFAIP